MAGIRADVDLKVNTSQAKRSAERAVAEINKVVNGIGGKQVSFNVNSRSFTQPLGRINASANEFTKSLEASNARVIAFGASVGIINGISDAFKGLVVETVKFEKTLTDINVVLNASAQSLERFGQGLFDVAKNTAQSFNVSAEAALEFSRQGLTMEEVLSRTNDALTLTRLTGLKAAEAVSGLTAAVNAFGGAGLTTTDIIDKLAAVDVKFAVSSADLINALERTGAVAIDAGVEIDSLIGLVTALQQTTARGGAVIGNGLKTIFTRIQRPESIRQLEEMGLAVRDLSGAILPADQLMLGMAKSFDKLTQSQQSNIVQFSAGIFQANVFRAALRDLSKEQSLQSQAAKIAADATGDAAKKNEILNKTMSAMASQTVTSLQELAETIGKLTLTPEIGSLLSFLQDGIEGFKNMLGGGEEQGSDFAKGLMRGLGNVLTGPAAVAFGAMFIKLFFNVSKFAAGSLKDVLGIVSEKDKIRQMEESITRALSENFKIQEGLNNLEGDRKAQEQFILGIIEKQNQAMVAQAKLAASLARPLIQAGVNPDFTKKSGKTGSSGVIPESAREEIQGAAKGGYRAGKVDSMNVPGMGEVVYNKAEKVKRFPGMKQPAIMPPQQSRAGKNYKDAFVGQHGFNPYASGGLVPNFARMQGNKLVLDKSLTKLSANPGSARTTDEIRKSYIDLVANGQPVNVEATMPQLLNNSGRGHSEKVKDVLKFLHQEAGVAAVSRQFDLKKLPFRGQKSDAAAEAAVLKKEGKGFFSTGGRSGDPTFPVDLAGLGMRPIEVKSGQWKLPNVLMKSMRLYSDDGLMEFAKNFGASEELISGARGEKFKKGSKMLIKKKLLAKDSTHEQKHQSLLDYRLSAGFVPNFTKKKAGSNYGSDADLLRDIIEDLGASEKYKYNSLKDITAAYSSRLSGTKESFTAKLSRFRNGSPGQRQGISDKEAIKLTGFLKTKVKLGQTGKRPKMHNDIDDKIIDDMINGNIDPVGAARKHGHGSGGGKDHSIIKQFKIQLKKAGKDEAHEYVSNYGKKDDDFKEDRELSRHLGLSFQRGERRPNIDIPAGAVDNQKLKEIGLGLSGKTTNWEAKRSLQHLRGKGIRQMLFEHRNKQGGLFDIIKSFDSKNPGKKEARAIDVTEQFGGALAIPGTRGKNYPTGAAMQLSAFTWKAMDKIFKAKFGRNEELAKQNKSIAADIMAEEYSLASRGFIPNYAVNLSNGYHDKRSIGKAISSVYKSKTGKQMGRKDVDFSIERYISAIKDKQADDGKNFVSNYPGGNFSVGGQKFNFNEISMALLKHGQFMEGQNKGLVPNFVNYSKYENFQGEYEDLAKMGSPLAKWALKTVKDKEFKMIGNGMESWAIGNEEMVYKLPRPQIDSFNKSGDLELERWRKQMKVMAQPSLQYKVSPENKAWNLVPNSNIAKRAERIRSQLDGLGINSLFLPKTEVLKVAGQDEFITSQERVKGSTFFNLQDEIVKNKKNKTDFNLDGYKIVEHLMENIGESTMIRDVHSGNFIAEASKKKQLLNTVNKFAPVGSKESKPLSRLGLRSLPNDSMAAIDFSSGLIPNFADLYKPYINKGGKPIGMENYFYSSNNQEDALNYIKSNKYLSRKNGISELRKFSFPPRVWKMLTSNNPQDIEPQMNVLPIGTRTPIGKGDPYRDTSLGKGMSEQEDFAAIALKNAYGIRPPFFEKTDSWRNGVTYTTLMTNSPQFREMYKLDRLDGKNVIPNFAANWKRFKKFDKDGYIKKIKKNKSNNEKAQIDAYVKAAGGAQKFQRLNEKFGLDKVDDIFQILGFAKGYVPNFANPLGDAVSREKAAGVPSSKIRIEKSSELKSPQNPMGLAVTNTRDEPMGVSQGIRRAKSMGIDPKRHGASSGLVPNFVDSRSEKLSQSGSKTKVSFGKLGEAADKATDSMEKNSMQSMMNLQRLFLFQSGLSVANGFLEQFAKEGGTAVSKMAGLGMAVTSITGSIIQQKTVVNELMESFDMSKEDGIGILDSLKGVATKEGRSNIKGSLAGSFKKGQDAFKGTKGFGKKLDFLIKGIGTVAKGFLRFAPIIGQLYTGFTIADEALKNFTGVFRKIPFFSELEDGEGIMDLFNSSADRAAKKLEKLSESAEKANAALEASQSLEKTEKEIRELSMKGQSRSVAEDLKLLQLQKAQLKQMSQLSKQLKGVSAANGESAQIIDLVNKVKSEEFNGTEKLTKALQALSLERERQLNVQSFKAAFEESMVDIKKTRLDPKSPGRIIMSKEQGVEIATLANKMARFIQTLEPERKNKIKGQLQVADKKNDIGEVSELRSLDKTLSDPVEGKLANLTLSIVKKLEEENKIETDKIRASKNLDKEIEKTIAAQKNNRKQIEFRGKINSQMNNMQRKEQSFLREILSEHGGILATTKIQEDSLDKLNKIQEDYNNKADSINNKLLDQAQDELNKRFKGNQASINKQLSNKTFEAGGDFELTGADAKILNKLNASLQKEEDVSKKRLMIAEADLKGRQALAFAFAANGEIEGSLVAKELEKFKKILKDKDDALTLNDISFKAQKESAEQEKIKAMIGKRTVDGALHLQKILESGIPHSKTAIAAMEGNAANLKVESNFREKGLQKILESSALINEANETQRQKNITDTEAAKKSLEQLNYQVRNFQTFKQLREFNFKKEVAAQDLSSKELKERLEIFSKTKDYKDLITNKLEDEITQAGLAERDAQIKNEFYNIEKNRIDLVTRQTNAEILNLNTTNLINQEKIKQLAEQGKITQLVAGQITENKISATGNLQVAQEKFKQTGSPEDAKALAEAMTAVNLEFQNGSRAADTLRERMAEMSVNAANLGADLVNIGFDNAKSGLKDLFKSIGSGAKSASEAWSDFGLGLAESLLDRIMEHNIDKIMSNLSFAFTGQDLLKDSNMLLKDAIDRNTMALQSASPPMPVKQFAKGGFVTGPAGVDKVPAMLTAGEYVVPKEEAQKFDNGTGQRGARQKGRVQSGVEGVTQLVVMNEVAKFVAKAMDDTKNTSSPPTFDKNKFKNLDLKSDVNIKRGDPRLSGRFLARDPVMQDYKDFLLEKAAYEVQKKNEKVDKKMQKIGSIVSMVAGTAVSGLVAAASPYISKAIQWGKDKAINTAMGHSGLGKHSESFKTARGQGIDMDYSDLKTAESTGYLISNDNKAYTMSREGAWRLDTSETLSHRKGLENRAQQQLKKKSIWKQSGGQIPAMLTAGEGFIPAETAKRIGYENLNKMNKTGGMPIIQGKPGVDQVGPVGLTEGDFIIKKNSTDKLLRDNPNAMKFAIQNPEGFRRGERGYYEGGVVGSSPVSPASVGRSPVSPAGNRAQESGVAGTLNQSSSAKNAEGMQGEKAVQSGPTTNNINVNVTIDQSGQEQVSTEGSSGSYEKEQEMSMKIKSAVLEVIRDEKRIGGELS